MKLSSKVELIRSSIIAVIFALYVNIVFQIGNKPSIANAPFFVLLIVTIGIAYICLLWSTNELYSRLAYQYFNQILVNIIGVCLISASFINFVIVINYKQLNLGKRVASVLTLANTSLIIGIATTIFNIVFWNKDHLLKDKLIIRIDTQKIKFCDDGQLTNSKKFNIIIANHSTNDKIIKINHEEINNNLEKVVNAIQEKGVGTILLTVERGNETLDIELTPDHVSTYYLGVNLKQAEDTIINHIIYGAMETKEFCFSIVDNLKQLFTGKVGIDQMMGPVGIAQTVSQTSNIQEFIYLLALVSLSLGVTNLLPIPALDGGKILILIIEAIRRKPLKQETELNIQLLGFSFLIVLSVYVAYNDVLRIF